MHYQINKDEQMTLQSWSLEQDFRIQKELTVEQEVINEKENKFLCNFFLTHMKNTSLQLSLYLNNSIELYSYNLILEYIRNNISSTIDNVLEKEINIINNPIFIVGCGHSGTTLLNKLLGHHSHIYNIKDESGIFLRISDKENRTKIYKLWSYICTNNGKIRWVEKTPKHVYHINTIFDDFPNAKVIIITRHGNAVSSSIKKRTGNFIDGVDRWCKDNIEWYENKNKSKCLIFKYENLIRDTVNIFQTICNYLEIPYQDLSNTKNNIENIDFNINPDELMTGENHINLRKWQINQSLYDNIEESQNNLTKDDEYILQKYNYDKYTFTDILKLLSYTP